ncbi:MAG: NAD(P)H oxidoreductase [Haliscomenobacteraceae bacterium CHB4]|nr:General stress protein 14 [Saprospiraceae bacterium]MCE7921798.1 NAD(P)H oxidoreductase [Haliscomenobacteraceae bacterium CHB4]
MARILVLFAHPALEKSRVNVQIARAVRELDGITFSDLYEQYPDFFIDVAAEQRLLTEHDIIVWQHPMYWYSCPPLLKQWIDLVLAHNWAYGSKGYALAGKYLFNAVTTGGGEAAYSQTGLNRYSLRQYLIPFEQTARLCRMTYLPPYAMQGTHRMDSSDIEKETSRYVGLLKDLRDERLDLDAAAKQELFNHLR